LRWWLGVLLKRALMRMSNVLHEYEQSSQAINDIEASGYTGGWRAVPDGEYRSGSRDAKS
jgi:hypothetical protein